MKALLNFQTKTVGLAAILLGASAFISRLLGLFRDRLLATTFGAGQELDIYFAAFRIPDFIFALLIIGGISAVFLPVFAEYFIKDPKEAWRLTSNILNCFLVLLIFFCIILAIFTPWIIELITPGFSQEQKSIAVDLTRIMFLSPIFLGLSSIFSGVLHYFKHFLAYALAPIFYNLGIILGILVFYPMFGLSGLAYGVILGAFLHLLIQIPAARSSGFRYLPFFDYKFPGLVKIFRLMIPRTIGVATHQFNLFIMTAIASTLQAGSIAIFNLANNLQHFPIGIIGVSLATAVFPNLSQSWANGVKQEFLEHFTAAFRQILFWIFPVSILIFILRFQIIKIIFSNGQFGLNEIRLTAASLGLFCLGLLAIAFIPFLARVFFSFQDTKTPVLISMTSVFFNVIMSFFFIWLLSFENIFQTSLRTIFTLQDIPDISVIGLPLALSLSGILQFSLLLFSLKKTIKEVDLKKIWRYVQKIILASFLMAISVYLTLFLITKLTGEQTYISVLVQAVLAAVIGISVYLLANLFLGFKILLGRIKNVK